jgi:hypothetical protein
VEYVNVPTLLSCPKERREISKAVGRMSLGRGWEKLNLALNSVASSEAPLPERLATVFAQDLGLINEDDLPPLVWERLNSMRFKVTTAQANGLYRANEASAAKLSKADAEKGLKEIVLLYDEVCREYARLEYGSG